MVEAPESRRTGKKARRQAEETARRSERERSERRGKIYRLAGIAAATVALVVMAVVLFTRQGGALSYEELGQVMPDQGRTHIAPGESHPPYNSTPPTSGWHLANVANWGVFQQPVPNELQIHNLEHGGILLQYNCGPEPAGGALDDAACKQLADELANINRRYRSKVLTAPYPGMTSRIAITSWGRIMTLDQVDETKIVRYIEQYKNKGPEFVPD